jgi:thioredoxin-related protein
MKIHKILLIIVPFIVGCTQPLTAEEYVRQQQLSFSENSTYRFDLLIDSMSKQGNEFGEKFFLIFLSNNCIFCRDLYPSIQELKENTKDYYDTIQHGEFLFYSFFLEQEIEAYTNWIYSLEGAYGDFFDAIYKIRTHSGFSFDFGAQNWPAPIVMFYDVRGVDKGVQIIWLGVPGNTTQDKVIKLANLWTYNNIENYP